MPPSASRAIVLPTTLHDRQRRMPPPLRLAQGGQRVGRLARLAEGEDERAVVERGVAVAELAGVLDLDRQVGQLLDQVLADQGRVLARAAGGEDDPADPAELPRRSGSARRSGRSPRRGGAGRGRRRAPSRAARRSP